MNLGFELANSDFHNENKVIENSGIATNNKIIVKSHINIVCKHLRIR